ncbi:MULTISPECIES: alpha/beta hydrolase [unclassified Brevibacterium]|uniref:alpha/beta fold hydrolase n=1 Tax=unclassified Brevibacterium TaxID=2614124 RepID=UPI0014850DD1|nr:alpha/beta hydrolase [Brevibacterium sp. 2SA]MCM1012921.1 alpha/beta hydrolase [Brevibacterium sp. XM4083]
MPVALAPDGSRLRYSIRLGAFPSLPPLVLVQGRALDHHGWDSARSDFSERTTIVFDHRGTGDSTSEFPPRWSTRDFALDVMAILDNAGIARAHFYGHSMGGRIVQWIGADHAERAVSIVIGATSVGDETGPPRPAEGAKALATLDTKTLASLFYPDWWIAENPREACKVLIAPQSPEAMRVHSEASDLRDGPHPESISVPALVLQGADDLLVDPGNAAIFGSRVPDVEVSIIPDARHSYWVGRPEVHKRVEEFLARHD